MGKGKWTKPLESEFMWDMPKDFHEHHSELLHIFYYPCIVGWVGRGCLNNIFKTWLDRSFVKWGRRDVEGKESTDKVTPFRLDW